MFRLWWEQESRSQRRKKRRHCRRRVNKRFTFPFHCMFSCAQNWFLSPLWLEGQSEAQVHIISSNILSSEGWNSDLQMLQTGRDETADAAGPRPLSVRQLLLRRGLTALLMVLILAAGILSSKMLLILLKWPINITLTAAWCLILWQSRTICWKQTEFNSNLGCFILLFSCSCSSKWNVFVFFHITYTNVL